MKFLEDRRLEKQGISERQGSQVLNKKFLRLVSFNFRIESYIKVFLKKVKNGQGSYLKFSPGSRIVILSSGIDVK